ARDRDTRRPLGPARPCPALSTQREPARRRAARRRNPFPADAEVDGREPRGRGGRRMSIDLIRPSAAKTAPAPRPLVSRDCGPEGCEVDWLASRRHEAELDIESFNNFALDKGWGDGLPLVPP